MHIKLSKKFNKQYHKAPPKIQKIFAHRIKLFIRDPFNPVLNNHALQGEFKHLRSINVTGDWRAIYSEDQKNKIILFEILGTHSQLYK